MTLDLDVANQLADRAGGRLGRRDPALLAVTPEDMLPFVDDIESWPGGAVDILKRNPASLYITLPTFLAWCRDNHRGPWAATASSPPRGGYQVGDLIEYRADDTWTGPFPVVARPDGEVYSPSAVRFRRPDGSTATVPIDWTRLYVAPFRPGEVIEYRDRSGVWHGPRTVVERPRNAVTPERSGDVWFRDTSGSTVFVSADRLRRYRLEGEHLPADQIEVHHEEPSPPAGYIPWGPEHPDWDTFWDKAQGAAERNQYCDEYDRVVRQIGGRERRPSRETVLFDVALSVTLTGPRGFGVDVHQVREALLDALPPGRTVGPVTIVEIDVGEVDEVHREGVE